MEKYLELRRRYPRFFYRGYEIEEQERELKVTYRFEIEGLSVFAPTWRFPKEEGDGGCRKKDPLLQDMVFSLGMVELVSYWKLACPPKVVVEAQALSPEQIAWWKDLYYNGLGEFFYVNHITQAGPEDFMEIEPAEVRKGTGCGALLHGLAETERGYEAAPDGGHQKGVIVPVGGGKDSAVTLELMRQAGETLYAYIINPRGATIRTAQVAGLDEAHVINVKRTLDANMLELNRQGYLNGHTPFSALVAFSSLIAARLYGLPYVALSNESSANESTVRGSAVNHQYSKKL